MPILPNSRIEFVKASSPSQDWEDGLCPICAKDAPTDVDSRTLAIFADCKRCGECEVTEEAWYALNAGFAIRRKTQWVNRRFLAPLSEKVGRRQGICYDVTLPHRKNWFHSVAEIADWPTPQTEDEKLRDFLFASSQINDVKGAVISGLEIPLELYWIETHEQFMYYLEFAANEGLVKWDKHFLSILPKGWRVVEGEVEPSQVTLSVPDIPRAIVDTDLPKFHDAAREGVSEMTGYYSQIYCLERQMRNILAAELQRACGEDWFEKCVPSGIRENARQLLVMESKTGVTPRSSRLLEYTTLGELGNIVESNWKCFESVFKNKDAMKKIMKELNILRVMVMHCTPLPPDEVKRLSVSINDWLRQLI